MSESENGAGELTLRDTASAELGEVQALHCLAFDGDGEARLVKEFHENCDEIISIVAEQRGSIVGHILFSPAHIETGPSLSVLGLAPMAVLPQYQRRNIGSQLVRHGLDRCRAQGVVAVVVLGHPTYYPRFGFRPAAELGLRCVYDVPAEVFMALELKEGALDDVAGTVHYHPLFGRL